MPCCINIYKENSNDENIMFTSEILEWPLKYFLWLFKSGYRWQLENWFRKLENLINHCAKHAYEGQYN